MGAVQTYQCVDGGGGAGMGGAHGIELNRENKHVFTRKHAIKNMKSPEPI